MTTPKFLYFDLGKVLVDFSRERMYRQIGEVAGVEPAAVERVIFDGGLQQDIELGKISGRQFYDAFCGHTGKRPDYNALERAGSDIFDLNLSLLPIVSQLHQISCKLGILSNTCNSHWEHCRRRFKIIAASFSVHALSYEIGAAKPDAAIFRAAAELAGFEPQEIFFVDDMAEHVAAARAVGFDAVQYTSASRLAAQLRERGLEFNY